jgi:hypothetical protein
MTRGQSKIDKGIGEKFERWTRQDESIAVSGSIALLIAVHRLKIHPDQWE